MMQEIPADRRREIMEFLEDKTVSCLWLAGYLNGWESLSSVQRDHWNFYANAEDAGAWQVLIAVERDIRLAFLAGSDHEEEAFQAASDFLVARVPLLKLCGPEDTIAAHLSDQPEFTAHVYRQHRQYTMTIGPEQLQIQPIGRLRPARLEDLPALKRHERIYNAERQVRLRRDYHTEIKEGSIFVFPLPNSDAIAGVIKMGYPSQHHVMILGTFIFPEYRHQGLGAQMMADLCDKIFKMTGLKAALNVDDDNEPAVLLYQKLGFQTVGTERVLYVGR